MCRLVAYAGPPVAVDRPLHAGSHSLLRQSWAPRELLSGSVNADGFGVIWYPGEAKAPLRLARTEPAWYDPEVKPLLAAQTSAVCVAALRNATPGLPVQRSGLLPLVVDRWAFTLNGYVPEFRERHMRALRAPLPDALYSRLQGVSDAETLFLRVVAEVDAGSSAEEALVTVARSVEERLPARTPAPLTMVLTHPDGHVVLHTNAGSGPCNSLYLGRGTDALGPGTALASEPLDAGAEWTAMPPDTLLSVGPDGGVTRSRRPDRARGPSPPG